MSRADGLQSALTGLFDEPSGELSTDFVGLPAHLGIPIVHGPLGGGERAVVIVRVDGTQGPR